jgi:DNA primase
VRRIPSDVYRELLVNQLAGVVGMQAGRLGTLLGSEATDGSAQGPAGGGSSGRSGHAASPHARLDSGGLHRAVRSTRASAGASPAGRGNLVRQAVTLLVHYPSAAAVVSAQQIEAVAGIDRPGIPLLAELLSQLREDPPASTAAVLERWRDRPEHGSLAKLAMAECLVPDAAGAAAELGSALVRLINEESPARRLDELLVKARDSALDEAEKVELQGLLAARGPASRRSPAAQ